MESFTDVKAGKAFDMFRKDLLLAMMMTPGATTTYVVTGWVPPPNAHVNVIKVADLQLGHPVDGATQQVGNELLNAVAVALHDDTEVNTQQFRASTTQLLSYAIKDDVIVVCVSDSPDFGTDFCERMVENVVLVSNQS